MNNEELTIQLNQLRDEVADLRFILSRKTGLSSADIKGRIVAPSTVSASTLAANSVNNAAMADNAIKQAELATETATVTITAGNPSGTASVTSGSIILGWYPQTNLDQIIDDMSVSGTTLTVTLATNATATTTIKVVLLKA